MENIPRKNEGCILAIDAGTQSIRAGLIDLHGRILQLVKTPIEPYFSRNPGWAEQEPEYYWSKLCATCLELFRGSSIPKESILGVAVTTQRATMIDVDEDGNPLRPAITWLDQRKADSTKILPGLLRPLLRAVRLHDLVDEVVRNCEATWIKQNQPEIWDKTHKHLLLSGYFIYKLTGEFVESTGNVVGYLPFDVKKQQWANKLDFKWRLFPMEKDKLPELKKPAEILGPISAQAAADTGIPQGLPLIAAGNDKACEILGAGCTSPEVACLSFGTTATVNTATRRYVELMPFFPPYPHAVPGEYYTEVSIFRGFWMVSWFKEEFGLSEVLASEKEQVPPEALFDRLIAAVPPGSMGLVLQPYWSPGPFIAGYAKGSIVGFGDIHTRAHFYRAILEGLIYALKEGAELTEKKTGIPITKLRISGGGSRSDAAMQIAADVFGLPAERPQTSETSALGAAIDAAVGLKLYSDFPSAVKNMTGVEKIFGPIPENHELYQKIYQRIYLKIYPRLLPLFKEIQQVTRYPE